MSLIRNFLEKTTADALFQYFQLNIPWHSGVTTRNGSISRLQCSSEECNQEVNDVLKNLITKIFNDIGSTNSMILGIYLNYYRDGSDYCPKHRHLGTKQAIISLGSDRNLTVGSNNYNLESGSLIFFGSDYH